MKKPRRRPGRSRAMGAVATARKKITVLLEKLRLSHSAVERKRLKGNLVRQRNELNALRRPVNMPVKKTPAGSSLRPRPSKNKP